VTLVDHQRGVLALIASDSSVLAADSYTAALENSMQLAVVQDIADSWRRFALQRICPLSWRLMEQRDRLAHHFGRLARHRGLSPFLEILARQFLDQVSTDDDPLDAAVATFERALIDAPAVPSPGAVRRDIIIEWPYDPEEVLGRLARGEPLGMLTPGRYRTVASSLDPASFTIEAFT
jgi:hypothetical protein